VAELDRYSPAPALKKTRPPTGLFQLSPILEDIDGILVVRKRTLPLILSIGDEARFLD
jgi:hypothetical protein